MPKHLHLSRDAYARKPWLDRYYAVTKHGGKMELRLDYPPPGLSDDPRAMQLMLDMHFDSLMRFGSHPSFSP